MLEVARRRLKKFAFSSIPGLSGRFPYYGSWVYFPSRSHVFALACDEGIYEREVLQSLIRVVKPGTAYFDVGANIGLLSVPILAHFRDVRVFSFEPSPNTLPYLRRTAESAGFGPRWTIVDAAATDTPGEREFFLAAPEEGAFDGLAWTGRVTTAGSVRLRTTTVDAEWQKARRPTVSAIKIDVEGAELEVLQGAKECLATCRPTVILECNETNLTSHGKRPEDLLTFSESTGYRLYGVRALSSISDSTDLHAQALLSENVVMIPAAGRADG